MRKFKKYSTKRPHLTGDKHVDRALGSVYDDINKLIDSVNTPALASEISDRDGKPGDIRIVKDKSYNIGRNIGGTAYFIEAKTDEGWVRQYMDNVNHSGISREGTIPLDMIKWETKKSIKQGSLSFWKSNSTFNPSATGTTSSDVYIDEDIIIGKNKAKTLSIQDGEGGGVLVKNDSNSLKFRNLADTDDIEIHAKAVRLRTGAAAGTDKVFEIAYDDDNYTRFTVGSTGYLSIEPTSDSGAGGPLYWNSVMLIFDSTSHRYITMEDEQGGGDANKHFYISGADAKVGTEDKQGGMIVLQGGQSTGDECGGDIFFQVSPAGTASSSTEKNTLISAGYFNGDDGILNLAKGLIMDSASIVFDASSGEETTLSTSATTGIFTIATTGTTSTDADIVLDAGGDIELNADNGTITFKDNAVPLGSFHSGGNFQILGNLDIIPSAGEMTRLETTATTGVFTLSTTATVAGNADMILDSGGDITLDSGTGVFIAKNAGTEFSAANSAYAGMILGYTRLQGDLTNSNSFEIQNAMTVEDSTHQITFKTPPSENVEIDCTYLIDVLSTDTEINIGISDNATYNSIGEQFEYDTTGVIFSDDEGDDHIVVSKFVLGAAQLEAVGVSNTFYIGFSTAGATKTAYLKYGLRASHGLANHPFVIKATALPATIYDGQ